MNYEDAANTIRSRFRTEIAVPESLQTQYDNAPFTPPDNEVWCRLSIIWETNNAVELGGSRFRKTGRMEAQLFGPVSRGDKAILELADKIVTPFRAVTDTLITFRTPSVFIVGRIGDDWVVIVPCPFYGDDTP